ncbi:MAG: DUF177 domain-containing protein [Gemmatimonadota bacterium]
MLSFDLRSVEANAVQVDSELAPNDSVWQHGDQVPAKPLRVTGRLSSAGSGGFVWHGRLEGDVIMPCRRCLTDTAATVQDDTYVMFAEAGSDETDDPDVYVLDERSNQLDIRPAVREQWLLNVPAFVQCREDCKGMCPKCGKNLNDGPCGCAATSDSRWDALRKVQT